MSAAEVFNAPIVERIDGRDVEFPRLYMDFYGTLEAAVRTNNVGVARAACDESDVKGMDRAVFVRDEGRRPLSIVDVDAYVGTEAGARKVLDKSLELAGLQPNERRDTIKKLQPLDAFRIARLTLGFAREYPADDGSMDREGPIEERKWAEEKSLIFKHFPELLNVKLTFDDYHLALGHARRREAALQPQQ